jgi:hypothetical protein
MTVSKDMMEGDYEGYCVVAGKNIVSLKEITL